MASRMGDAVETRWARILLLGLTVWLIALIFSYVLYWVEVFDHNYYLITMTGITAMSALYCALRHCCAGVVDSRLEGLLIGVVWVIQIAAFNATFMYFAKLDWMHYLINESWYNLYIPVITLLAGLYCFSRGRQASMALGPTFRGPIGHR